MTTKHLIFKIFAPLLLTLIAINITAQEVCTALVDAALDTVANNCSNLGRNEACYGNLQLTATGRTTNFTFTQVGDIEQVAEFDTITSSPSNLNAGIWGIAVMSLQANLPDTLPGQNVTVFVLGNTELQNQVVEARSFSGLINADARVRNTPVSGQVIYSLELGSPVTIFGRNDSSDWLRIIDEQGNYGWIAAFLVDFTDDVSSLSIVDVDAKLPPSPMQVFTLSTGIGQSTCNDVPQGILIQTPDDALSVDITVNGVTINMGSTLHLSVTSDNGEQVPVLTVRTLEGIGIISNEFGVNVAPAGTQVTIPLDETGTQASAMPSNPIPIPQAELDNLNNLVQSAGYAQILNDETSAPETVTQELSNAEIDNLLAPPANSNDMSGTWEWVFFVRYEGGSACHITGQEPGQYGGPIEVVFDGDTMSYTGSSGRTSTFTRSSGNTYSTFDTTTFSFTVESPFYMSYQRTPPYTYTVAGTNCTQTISGYAFRK